MCAYNLTFINFNDIFAPFKVPEYTDSLIAWKLHCIDIWNAFST